MYDAIIAGGSISGLLTAREIAKKGNSVLVLEEGFEVGSPEHCGGLVSKSALDDLGINPSVKSFDNKQIAGIYHNSLSLITGWTQQRHNFELVNRINGNIYIDV